LQDEAIVYSIAVDPLNTQNVYIATRGISNQGAPPWRGVVYKSTNAGETWLPSLTNVGGETIQDWVYSLSIHPTSPSVIYAAAQSKGLTATWMLVSPGRWLNGITDNSGRAIAMDPLSNLPATIYWRMAWRWRVQITWW
jgi:hypothetical protein